jgi:hypothetical protein
MGPMGPGPKRTGGRGRAGFWIFWPKDPSNQRGVASPLNLLQTCLQKVLIIRLGSLRCWNSVHSQRLFEAYSSLGHSRSFVCVWPKIRPRGNMQFVEFLGLGMFPFCTFVIGVVRPAYIVPYLHCWAICLGWVAYKNLYGFVWLHIDLYGSVRICMYLYCLILMYR